MTPDASASFIETIFLQDWLGKPAWVWMVFIGIIITLLVLDLGVFHRKSRAVSVRESLVMSAWYIAIGVGYGFWVWYALGADQGMAYLTGFAVEKALALDNVFVIAMIFESFAVKPEQQHRVLFWGIIGVIVLRAIMIAAGAAVVTEFAWVLTIFALLLIATGIKMLVSGGEGSQKLATALIAWLKRRFPVVEHAAGDAFFVRAPSPADQRQRWYMTPLFLALLAVELADLVFAIDSVPAIFAITTDPFIIYTSNIFAILGLRSLYFALAAMRSRFHHLGTALAVVLVFIGGKIIVADLLGIEKVPAALSLGVTVAILTAGIVASLVTSRPATKSPN